MPISLIVGKAVTASARGLLFVFHVSEGVMEAAGPANQLRYSNFIALREDKDAEQIRREQSRRRRTYGKAHSLGVMGASAQRL
jgi:hypothetical protein